MKDKKIILKVLVGSRAHGLADKNADYDYRGVYVLPTSKVLSLNYKYKGNDWIEGKEDNTSYEIGHFLQLATKCNPTILEVFKAPVIEINKDGEDLRKLFPYVWNPIDAFNAFVGYGLNQRKKFLNKKDNRQNKFAVAYIRTLYSLIRLLESGSFDVEVKFDILKEQLLKYKNGEYKLGEVIDSAEILTEMAKERLQECNHKPNIEKVNDFLLKIRQKYWDFYDEFHR